MAIVFSQTEKPTIQAESRQTSGKGVARKLRAAGKIPGTLYGYKLEKAESLVLDPEVMTALLTTKKRRNIVFKLEVNGKHYEHVMVRDYQIDPVKRNILHADLIVINPDVPVSVSVPVEVTGRPIGVRQGGRLQTVRALIPIRCLPNAIPFVLEHDVTKLSMGQAVLASQVKYPEGVEPDFAVDFAVVRIAIPRGASLPADSDEEEEEEGTEEGTTSEG